MDHWHNLPKINLDIINTVPNIYSDHSLQQNQKYQETQKKNQFKMLNDSSESKSKMLIDLVTVPISRCYTNIRNITDVNIQRRLKKIEGRIKKKELESRRRV